MDEESNLYICDFEDEYTDKDKRQLNPYIKLIYQTSYIIAGGLITGIIVWSFIELYH